MSAGLDFLEPHADGVPGRSPRMTISRNKRTRRWTVVIALPAVVCAVLLAGQLSAMPWRSSASNDCTVEGTSGADVLTGTSRADVICGLDGDDVLKGLGGGDRL